MLRSTMALVAAFAVAGVEESASAQYSGGNYGPSNSAAPDYDYGTRPYDSFRPRRPSSRSQSEFPSRGFGSSYPTGFESTTGVDSNNHQNCRDGFCGSTGNGRNRCCTDCRPGECASGRCSPTCRGTCCAKRGRCTDCVSGDCSRGTCPPNCRDHGGCTDGCCSPGSNPSTLPPATEYNDGPRYLDSPTTSSRRLPTYPTRYRPSYPSSGASYGNSRFNSTDPYTP